MNKPSASSAYPLVLFVAMPMVVLLGVTLVSWLGAIPIDRFMKDPAALARQHPLWGVVSNLGNLLWCVCLAVCAFSAHLLSRRQHPVRARVRQLQAAALVTLVLLLDDLFMGHDDLGKRYLGTGEWAVVVLLGAAVAAYVWRFGKLIMARNGGLLLFALVCLASSLLVDGLNDRLLLGMSPWTYFAEDAPKFLGIAAWCGYHYQLAMTLLESRGEAMPSAAANESRPLDLETPRAAA